MSISLKNHDDRISALEKRSSGSVDMCMYSGERKNNNPVYTLRQYHAADWCVRNSDGTFKLQPGTYIVRLISYVTWYGTSGQLWNFKITCGNFSYSVSRDSDNFGHGNADIVAAFTISAESNMTLYLNPARAWNYGEPSSLFVWKIK